MLKRCIICNGTKDSSIHDTESKINEIRMNSHPFDPMQFDVRRKDLESRLIEAERVIDEYSKIDSSHWGIAGSYKGDAPVILWSGEGNGCDLAQMYRLKYPK
jgi:hypothetical protein